jgi:hypothetical protein
MNKQILRIFSGAAPGTGVLSLALPQGAEVYCCPTRQKALEQGNQEWNQNSISLSRSTHI